MSIKSSSTKPIKGFTLIEVMVAMFIMATAVSALMLKMMSIVDNTVYLEQKTVANWVALNQIELLRLKNKHSNRVPSDESAGQEEMAGRTWHWRMKPVKTANDGFIEMRVSVSDQADSDEPLVTVSALVDRYHKSQ